MVGWQQVDVKAKTDEMLFLLSFLLCCLCLDFFAVYENENVWTTQVTWKI